MRPILKIIALLFLILTISCNSKNSISQNQETTNNVNNNKNEKIYYFADKTSADSEKGKFNYMFMQFRVTNDSVVEGFSISAPYGTDGSKGTCKGVFIKKVNEFRISEDRIVEGNRYIEKFNYQIIRDTALNLGYNDYKGNPMLMKKVSSNDFENLLNEYQKQCLRYTSINEDRTRLKQIITFKNLKYSDAEIKDMQFNESYVELDNNTSTSEYLLYLKRPINFSKNKSNLYIVNGKGEVLFETETIRPLIYLPLLSIDEMKQHENQWRNIYLISNGIKVLSNKNMKGSYNYSSIEKNITENKLKYSPAYFQLVISSND